VEVDVVFRTVDGRRNELHETCYQRATIALMIEFVWCFGCDVSRYSSRPSWSQHVCPALQILHAGKVKYVI
jgi:hypothetical protein